MFGDYSSVVLRRLRAVLSVLLLIVVFMPMQLSAEIAVSEQAGEGAATHREIADEEVSKPADKAPDEVLSKAPISMQNISDVVPQEIDLEDAPPEEVAASENVISSVPLSGEECLALRNDVSKRLRGANTRWDNKECQAINFGCPWQLGHCYHHIVSTGHEEEFSEIFAMMSRYENQCVQPNEALRNRCREATKRLINEGCVPPEVLCLNGRCVTQTHVLIQGDL